MATTFLCVSEDRREAVRRLTGATPLNGIDFVEVIAGAPPSLELHMLHPLTVPLTQENFFIDGGVRVRNIVVNTITPSPVTGASVVTIAVGEDGDRSPYTLRIGNALPSLGVPTGIDPQLSAVDFVFHPECGDFDCSPTTTCPPPVFPVPQIDYLARDYTALRQQLLDRVSLLIPGWKGRNAADIGVMLLEVLAFSGDYLSYRQDAVATEAYLSTARLHTSVRRHGRLVDYQMHSGHNARAWIQIHVTADVLGGALTAVPSSTQLLTDQHGLTVVPPSTWTGFSAAVQAGAGVFETIYDLKNLYLAHNQIPFHTWGASECCLAAGSTRATLKGSLPNLQIGDVLILAEARGPNTGDPADADILRRQAVTLTSVDATQSDPFDGQLITDITWHPDDALTFPLCIASRDQAGNPVVDVSYAYGNIVLADHGRTIGPPVEPSAQEALPAVPAMGRYLPQLAVDPVTYASPPLPATLPGATPNSAQSMFVAQPTLAVATVTLTDTTSAETWTPRVWLLDSDVTADSRYFVAESEPGAGTTLRFGDDTHGRKPDQQTTFTASYRVGNGRVGNVGADSIHHILVQHPEIDLVWNPIAAAGGTDPESIDEARQKIPFAFRTQLRTVTPADYAAEAMSVAGVQRATARMRWTGSWYTVSVTVDPIGGVLTDTLKAQIQLALDEKRMAGHDVEVETATLVPLVIEMSVCIAPGRSANDVRTAIFAILTNGLQPDGTLGLFNPDRILMGAPFYVSPLYAAAQSVDGVTDVRITRFEREDLPGSQGLIDGYLTPGVTEAFAVQNDPSFPEHGTFSLLVQGGV